MFVCVCLFVYTCLIFILVLLLPFFFSHSCVAGKYGDAQEFSIPVYSPPTTRQLVTTQQIKARSDVLAQSIVIPNGNLFYFIFIFFLFLFIFYLFTLFYSSFELSYFILLLL
jgi:hypothetical protein